MNKYERIPEYVLDLHRHTKAEAEVALKQVVKEARYEHIRIITGKGLHSSNGPVIKNFVRSYLQNKNIKFSQSKIADGGEGAYEVFL